MLVEKAANLVEIGRLGKHLDVGVGDAELGGGRTGDRLGGHAHRIAYDVDGGQRGAVLVYDEIFHEDPSKLAGPSKSTRSAEVPKARRMAEAKRTPVRELPASREDGVHRRFAAHEPFRRLAKRQSPSTSSP